MRLLYTLFAAFAVCFTCSAQVIIGQENAPLIGDSWATYNLILPPAQFPVPAVGAEMAYDFTGVGDFVDEDFGVAVKDIALDNFGRNDILAIPVGTNDPVFDSLPETALLANFVFPELDDNGNEFALRTVIDVTEAGVFALAEDDFVFTEDGFSIELESLEEPEQLFTFGRAFGASITTSTSVVEDDLDFNTQDSTYSTETITYAGYGSLKTWFGEYEEVAVYRSFREFRLYTRPLGSDDAFSIASVQLTVTYDFIRPGSFAPVVSYFYDTFDRDGMAPANDINFSFAVPLNLTDASYVDAGQLQLSAAPNPATEEVNVSFEQLTTGPVLLSLYDATSREVMRRDLGVLPAGNQRVPVSLPTGLPGGTYFLRLGSGVRTEAIPLVVGRR